MSYDFIVGSGIQLIEYLPHLVPVSLFITINYDRVTTPGVGLGLALGFSVPSIVDLGNLKDLFF